MTAMTPWWGRWGRTFVALALLLMSTLVEGGGGGGVFSSVFTGELDLVCVGEQLVYVLIFTMVFEAIVDRIDQRTEENEATHALFVKVVQELMILGFMGFSLTISTEFMTVEHDMLLCFEFADILTFLVALIYVVNCFFIIYHLKVVKRQYDQISLKSVSAVVSDYQEKGPRGCLANFFGDNEETEAVQWKVLQLLFIQQYAVTAEFDYPRYVKYNLEKHLTALIAISSYTWMYLVIFGVVVVIAGGSTVWDGGASSKYLGSVMDQDDNFTARRMLGAASAATGGCCINAPNFDDNLLGMCINATNTSSQAIGVAFLKTEMCSKYSCATETETIHGKEINNASVLWTSLGVGWGLFFLNLAIMRMIRRKKLKVLRMLSISVLGHDVFDLEATITKIDALGPHELHALEVDGLEEYTSDDVDGSRSPLSEDGKYDEDNQGGMDMEDSTLFTELPYASHIITQKTKRRYVLVCQVIILANAFYFGIYLCHTIHIVDDMVGTYFVVQPNEVGLMRSLATLVAHAMLIAPWWFITSYVSPMAIERLALLDGITYVNHEIVEKTENYTNEILELRKRIRDRLMGAELQRKKRVKAQTKAFDDSFLIDAVEVCCEIHRMFLDPEHPNHEELYVDQSSPRGTTWTSISTSKLDVVVDIDALIELSAKIPGCTPGSTKLSVLKKICLEAERRADVQGNITVESVIHANQTRLGMALNAAQKLGVSEDTLAKAMNMLAASRYDREEINAIEHLGRAIQLFNKADVDDSGELGEQELHDLLTKAKCGITEKEFSRLFKLMLRMSNDSNEEILTRQDWETFMLSSDAALLANSVAQDLVEVTENAAKSTSMFAMMQEGVAGVAGEVVLIAREVEEVAQDLAEESLQALTVGDSPDDPVHPAERHEGLEMTNASHQHDHHRHTNKHAKEDYEEQRADTQADIDARFADIENGESDDAGKGKGKGKSKGKGKGKKGGKKGGKGKKEDPPEPEPEPEKGKKKKGGKKGSKKAGKKGKQKKGSASEVSEDET